MFHVFRLQDYGAPSSDDVFARARHLANSSEYRLEEFIRAGACAWIVCSAPAQGCVESGLLDACMDRMFRSGAERERSGLLDA